MNSTGVVLDLPPFAAMVLSAGFGTRLSPLTDEIPKPLVTIGDRPLLVTTLETLRQQGATRLVVNVHHRFDKITNIISNLDFKAHVLHEETILGTGGGIAGARSLLSGRPTLVVNGDIVGDLPVKKLLENPTDGLRLATVRRRVGEGTVGVGSRGEVVRLRGERFGKELSSGDYVGVAQLGDRCLEGLPGEGCLIGDWALPELRRGGRIETAFVEMEFQDIGTPEAYLNANLAWLQERAEPCAGSGGSFLDADAQIGAGVQLRSVVVGKGARLEGAGVVEESVLLPGAVAHAPLRRVVVTPSGKVMQIPRS